MKPSNASRLALNLPAKICPQIYLLLRQSGTHFSLQKTPHKRPNWNFYPVLVIGPDTCRGFAMTDTVIRNVLRRAVNICGVKLFENQEFFQA